MLFAQQDIFKINFTVDQGIGINTQEELSLVEKEKRNLCQVKYLNARFTNKTKRLRVQSAEVFVKVQILWDLVKQ